MEKGGHIFSAKLGFTNKVLNTLTAHGEKKITAIRIAREPIEEIIEKALNVISLGKWGRLKKKYNFDTLFHLSIQMNLEDGTILSFEKIDVVNLEEKAICNKKSVKCKEIAYNQNSLTVNEFVKEPLKTIPKKQYFEYSSFKYNCQDFISKILASHNLLTAPDKTFIYQDISQIVKELPFFTKWGADLVTGTIAFKKKITGAGEPKCKMFVREKRESIPPEEEDPKIKDLKQLTEFVLNIIEESNEDE